MNKIARDKMQHLGHIFLNISTVGIVIFILSLLSQFFQWFAIIFVIILAIIIVGGTLGLSLINEGVRTFLSKSFDFSTSGWISEISLKLQEALPYLTISLGIILALGIVCLSFNAKNDKWKLIKICTIAVAFLLTTILTGSVIFGGAN